MTRAELVEWAQQRHEALPRRRAHERSFVSAAIRPASNGLARP